VEHHSFHQEPPIQDFCAGPAMKQKFSQSRCGRFHSPKNQRKTIPPARAVFLPCSFDFAPPYFFPILGYSSLVKAIRAIPALAIRSA